MSLAHFLEKKTKKPERLRGSDLHRAIINGDLEEISALLKKGVPMEVQNSRGLTPLQVACTKGDVEVVTALMRAGCNVHSSSGCSNKTALSTAAFAGNLEVFELLSNQGGKSKSSFYIFQIFCTCMIITKNYTFFL